MILNNILNQILSWYKLMNRILNPYYQFLIKSPLYFLFWASFGHFLGTFWFIQYQCIECNDFLTIELNYLLMWYTRVYFELNNSFNWTRPKLAFGRQGQDWIVGPKHNFRMFSTWKWITNQDPRKPWKPT